MAQLQSTSITGSLNMATVGNTGSVGNLWFNTTTNTLNLSYCFTGSFWKVGGAMITARQVLAGAGTNTAALAFGGATPTIVACTESYNGTSWSAGGAMITARCVLAGAGTNTAALAFGGKYGGGAVTCTESYNSYNEIFVCTI